jgi:hypothetical protein
MIPPISRAIRELKRQIADAEWAGHDATALRTALASLQLMHARGEQWAPPF